MLSQLDWGFWIDMIAGVTCGFSSVLSVSAMQVVVVRTPLLHLQRLALAILSLTLLGNAFSSVHTKEGAMVSTALLLFMVVFNLRGYWARRHSGYKIEDQQQPIEYAKSWLYRLTH